MNVPPEERSPGALGNATRVAIAASLIEGFNAALGRHLAQFAARNKDARVIPFDAHAWFTSALDNAAHLGFKNITGCAR